MIYWESLKKLDEFQKEFMNQWGKLYEDLKDVAEKQTYQEDFCIKDFPSEIKKILAEMVNDCLDNTYILTENNKYTVEDKKQLFLFSSWNAWFVWEKGFKGDPVIRWIN